jgi:hypothetical protein
MQRGAGVGEGMVARLAIELDHEERRVDPPIQLIRILKQDRSLRRWYDELNYSTRNDIAKWIKEPKSVETRERRADQIAERLLAVMEAERELPPILELAFARHPRARQGWEMMSRSRRQGHLFGIFYYRTPEAQTRLSWWLKTQLTSSAPRLASQSISPAATTVISLPSLELPPFRCPLLLRMRQLSEARACS